MRTQIILLLSLLSACKSAPPTDTDPCALPASATPVSYTDLSTVEMSCFANAALTWPIVIDDESELGAVYICDDLWPGTVDWATQRVVVGAPTSCGTTLRDVGLQTSGSIEVLLFGQGCGAPMEVLHGVVLPDGAEPVEMTICAQDTGLYP